MYTYIRIFYVYITALYDIFMRYWNIHVIISGKILIDDKPLTEYSIDEKKFIVLMITKPKAGSASAASEEHNVESDNKEATTTRYSMI